MIDLGYYDRDGKEIDAPTWGRLHADMDYKILVKDKVGDAEISTVWLGMNHAFTEGPPIIFETMIFGGKFDQECIRYCTEKEAFDGHHRILKRLEKGKNVEETVSTED